MSDLDSYFKGGTLQGESRPLIRLLDVHQEKPEFCEAKVEILRPRAALGFEPARLSLQFFNMEDKMYDYKTEPWDAELNDAFLCRKIRAINESNEIQRFGLAVGAAFQRPENRYGDGFFSAVLMRVVDQSPFAFMAPVQQLRPHISANKPYDGGDSSDDCRAMIQAVLQERWDELRETLGYDKQVAERILAGALAYFLDERFSITDGRKLGWLKEH